MGISQSSALYNALPVVVVACIIGLLFALGTAYACLFHPKFVGERPGKNKGKTAAYPSTTRPLQAHKALSQPDLELGHVPRGDTQAAPQIGIQLESISQTPKPGPNDPLVPNRLTLDSRSRSEVNLAEEDVAPHTPASIPPRIPPQALTRSHLNLSDFDIDHRSTTHSISPTHHYPPTSARSADSGNADSTFLPYTPPPGSAALSYPPNSPPPDSVRTGSPPRSPTCESAPLSVYDDDGASMKTSSTLPPSYRTRRSIPDLFHHAHPSPPLPPVPPSAYRRNRRHSRGAGRLVADLQAAGWGRDTPDGEGENAHDAGQQEHRSGMQRKRSKDAGVRLQGGRPGEQPLEPDDDSAEVHDVGSTRPPSYG